MRGFYQLLLACLLGLLFFVPGARAESTAFTFQGRLDDNGAPANGNYDLELKLFTTATVGQGTQIGATFTRTAVPVASGVFTVRPDFGANAFPGADRFMQVAVKPSGGTGAFTTLTPRQPITPTPYALHSDSATTATNATNAMNASHATSATTAATATNSTKLDGVAGSQYVVTTDSRLSDARPPTPGSADYIQNRTSPQAASFNVSGNGSIGGALTVGTVSGALILSNKIGVGAADPLAPLDVRGNVFVGLTADPNLGANALYIANDSGDANNSFLLDGFADTLQIIGHSSSGAAHGTNILFRTAAPGGGEQDQVVINSSGRVGIGTDSPQAKLEVAGDVKADGDVRLGSVGQYFAPSGEENLRIIRGTIGVDGSTGAYVISHGSGFTISSPSTGVVYVTFNTAFSGIPAILVTPDRNGGSNYIAQLDANCGCDRTQQVKIVTVFVDQPTLGAPAAFDFIAMGPR